MVAPSWESFQRPNKKIIDSEEREFSQEVPGDIQDQESPEVQKPQWGNFQTPETFQGEVDPVEEEGMFEYVVRNAVANASRLGEQIGGRFGNIEKFAKDTLVNFPKQTGGLLGWAVSELVGPEKWERLIKGSGEQYLPTSEQLKQVSQGVTKGYTTPKTKGEEKFQGFTEDVGAVLGSRSPRNVPGRPEATQAAINKLLIPAASNVAKNIVEDLGFGEDKANMVKGVLWLGLSLAGNVNAPRYASNLMNQGRQQIPQNAQYDVPRFLRRLQDAENTLQSSDPRTALARQQINNLRNDIQTGQTSVRDAMNMFDGTNAMKRNRGMFEMGRTDQNFARHAIDRVKNAVRDEIVDSSAQYPQALQNWRNGVQAWAVIHQSRGITNWIESVAKGPYAKILTGPVAGIFGIGTLGAAKAPILGLTGSAATPLAYKTAQTLYRVYEDPRLRNYYFNAISAAQRENIPAFISNYEKLDKELKKSDSSQIKSKSKN